MAPNGDIYMHHGMRGPLAPDPQHAMYYAAGAAVLGGILGGWLGKHAGLIAGTIGGALSLGMVGWYYFSGRGVPTVAQIEQTVAGTVPAVVGSD